MFNSQIILCNLTELSLGHLTVAVEPYFLLKRGTEKGEGRDGDRNTDAVSYFWGLPPSKFTFSKPSAAYGESSVGCLF